MRLLGFVEDLVNAFLLAQEKITNISGQAFNIGGSPANTISLLELIALIKELEHQVPNVQFEAWRPADQLYYVSDVRKFATATGWRPRVGVREGIARLHEWLIESRQPSFAAGEFSLSMNGGRASPRAALR